MSVINNVLKDLESRESRFTPIDVSPVARPETPARNLKPYLIAGPLLLMAATAFWFYLHNPMLSAATPQSPPAPVDTDSVVSDELAPVAVIEPSTMAEPVVTDMTIGNQIIGLEIHESEQEMRLEFVLREKVVAYLKARGESSFGYHMRDIESQIVAPVIEDNRWIESLSIVGADRGVDINFETADDILVETRQIQVDGEPAWAINLRKTTPPVAQVSQQAKALSSPLEMQAESSTQVAAVADPESPVAAEPLVIEEPATRVAEDIVKAEVRLEIKSTNPNAKAVSQLDYAVQLINSGRSVEAEKLLLGLLSGSEDYRARQHLLALYGRHKRDDRSIRLLRESVVEYPRDSLFRNEYARVLFQNGAYRTVIEMFAGKDNSDATSLALIAASHQRLEQHAQAVDYYQLALGQDAGNARNWIALGISQEHNSAFEDALNSYRRAGQLGNLTARLQAFIDRKSDTLEQVLN